MSQYFENDPNLKSQEKKIHVSMLGTDYTFLTDLGVFAKHGFDYGSRLLLKNIDFKTIQGNVLDLGCGYGPIGIMVANNIKYPVDMVDVNERALSLSRKNAKLNKIENVNIFKSDGYEFVQNLYQTIITNPPIRAGKQVLLNMLMNAKDHLEDGGNLIFVMRKNHGVKSIIKIIEKEYQVTVLDRDKGFYIVNCKK